MSAQREAFDLFNPACRKNFRHGLRRNKFRLWWWRLVLSDTIRRVCSRTREAA